MSKLLDHLKTAKDYVWQAYVNGHQATYKEHQQSAELFWNELERSPRHLSLDRQLQYRLCAYIDRMEHVFGEVTRKDIAIFIETWVASDPKYSRRPFRFPNEPENL